MVEWSNRRQVQHLSLALNSFSARSIYFRWKTTQTWIYLTSGDSSRWSYHQIAKFRFVAIYFLSDVKSYATNLSVHNLCACMVYRQKVMKRIGSGLEGRGQQVKIISLLMVMKVVVTVMILMIIAVVVIFMMRTAGWAPSLCGRGHRLRIR